MWLPGVQSCWRCSGWLLKSLVLLLGVWVVARVLLRKSVLAHFCVSYQLLSRSVYDVLTQISNDFQRSLYRVQFRQTLAVAARCGASGVDTVLLTYREETKQPRRPIAGLPLLEFSPALESWSDIYTGPTSCLIILQTFSSFVFYPPSLFFCRRSVRLMSVMCTDERSLLCIMSRHTPYCWLATILFWYSAPTQFSKEFLKNDIPHL